jgi:PASTA domain-containing protein
VSLFGACALVVFGAASPSAAEPVFSGGAVSSGASAAFVASGGWRAGVEAVLPANAATNRFVDINSVSCASAGNCSAVGVYDDSSGGRQGLLLSETAGAWGAGVEADLPANAAIDASQFVTLFSVSCASAGNCSAVGSYRDSSGGYQGLLLSETAGSWATGVEAVLPANAATPNPRPSLVSVSCPSAGNCSAVGVYPDSSGGRQGLLLSETAGAWGAGVEAGLPANAATGTEQEVDINSVSCASAGNCSAVGDYGASGGGGRVLLLTETAGTWRSGVEAALPANAVTGDVSLASVSCASAGNCSAVGTYQGPTGCDRCESARGLLLTETGGKWRAGVEAVLPADAYAPGPGVELASVSCASAGNCSAVGGYLSSTESGGGLLLSERAGRWSKGVEAPYGGLTSVSCPSRRNCSAVGYYGPRGMALLTETAGNWTAVNAALPADAATGPNRFVEPNSISCASAGNCSAVGLYIDSSGNYQGLLLDSTPLPPCLVPKLKEKTLAAAKRSIRSHACSVGRIKHAASQTITKGRVISQRPKPGRRLQHGAEVNLVVSKGKR